MIEVEVKKTTLVESSEDICSFCDSPIREVAKIGEVQNHYGTDYDLCGSAGCRDKALEAEIEELDYNRSHRYELMQAERWNNREGK